MNSNQLKRLLAKHGCSFETKKGTGHIIVRKGSLKTELPMHGGNQELGTGLVNKILKELGLK